MKVEMAMEATKEAKMELVELAGEDLEAAAMVEDAMEAGEEEATEEEGSMAASEVAIW